MTDVCAMLVSRVIFTVRKIDSTSSFRAESGCTVGHRVYWVTTVLLGHHGPTGSPRSYWVTTVLLGHHGPTGSPRSYWVTTGLLGHHGPTGSRAKPTPTYRATTSYWLLVYVTSNLILCLVGYLRWLGKDILEGKKVGKTEVKSRGNEKSRKC